MKLEDKNHFALFSLPIKFHVDLDQLSDAYRKLQSQFHPDRFAHEGERERLKAVQLTSILNEAYETLRSPLRRAAYLLSLQGVDVERVTQSDLSPQLLLEQIQLREELEEIPRDEAALEVLERLRTRVAGRLSVCEQAFGQGMDHGDLTQAKQNYFEMLYFSKLAADIEGVEEELLGY